MQAQPTIVRNAVCNLCGCVCDDLELTVEANRIQEAKNVCALAEPWFLAQPNEARPSALLRGQPVELDAAVEEAACLLLNARYPLLYGFAETTCEGQRLGVAIADRIGATIDTPPTHVDQSAILAKQAVGQVTCSLGEVKNYADLIVFWRANPAKSHPRHGERYSIDTPGLFVPHGRRDRRIVTIGADQSEIMPGADIELRIKPDMDFEVVWALRAMIKGTPVNTSLEQGTGISIEELAKLAERMKTCKCGAFFFGNALSSARNGHRNIEAAFCLVRDLNAFTRWYALPLGGPGNGTGAGNVLTWQTGFPFAANLSRGYPRFNPGEFSATQIVEWGETDVALIVGADPLADFAAQARENLSRLPYIAIDCRESASMRGATVAFATATILSSAYGTIYRPDGVSIPLRPALQSPQPSDEAVLGAIEKRICELQSALQVYL